MTTLAELSDIASAIHDEYFDVERLDRDVDNGVLRVWIYPGRRTKRWVIETIRPPEEPLPPPIGALVVRRVVDLAVTDDQGIRWYSIERLDYEPETAQLRIISNEICEVVVECRELEVELAHG